MRATPFRFSVIWLMWATAFAAILMSLARDMSRAMASRTPAAQISAVTFSPSAQVLAVGYENGTVHLWDIASGQRRRSLVAHSAIITALQFSPDSRTLATGADDGSVKLWNLERGTISGRWPSAAAVTGLFFTADGSAIAVLNAEHNLELRGVVDLRCRLRVASHFAGVSPDGRRVATRHWERSHFVTSIYRTDTGARDTADDNQFRWSPPALPAGQWRLSAGSGWSGQRVYISSLVEPNDLRFLGWHRCAA